MRAVGVLGGKLYVLASHRDRMVRRAGAKLSSTRQVVSLTQSSASPRRLPELEDFPHDAVVPELAQENNRPIGGRCAFFEYVSFEYGFASWTRAAARVQDANPYSKETYSKNAQRPPIGRLFSCASSGTTASCGKSSSSGRRRGDALLWVRDTTCLVEDSFAPARRTMRSR